MTNDAMDSVLRSAFWILAFLLLLGGLGVALLTLFS